MQNSVFPMHKQEACPFLLLLFRKCSERDIPVMLILGYQVFLLQCAFVSLQTCGRLSKESAECFFAECCKKQSAKLSLVFILENYSLNFARLKVCNWLKHGGG